MMDENDRMFVNNTLKQIREDKDLLLTDMAKSESAARKLVEYIQQEKLTEAKLHANRREARWKLDMIRTQFECLDTLFKSLEKKKLSIVEIISRLERKTHNPFPSNTNEEICRFEEQMAHIVSILNEARQYYTEENLNVEKREILKKLENHSALDEKNKKEIEDINNQLKTLEVDDEMTDFGYNTDADLQIELTNVLGIVKKENRQSKTVLDNYNTITLD